MKPTWKIGIGILAVVMILGVVLLGLYVNLPDSDNDGIPDEFDDDEILDEEGVMRFTIHPATITYEEDTGKYIFEGTFGNPPSGQLYHIEYNEIIVEIIGGNRIYLADLSIGDEITLSRINTPDLDSETKTLNIP